MTLVWQSSFFAICNDLQSHTNTFQPQKVPHKTSEYLEALQLAN